MSANVLWSYPQSSCNCWNCDKEDYPSPQGWPTNFSVEGCKVPKSFNCHDRQVFQKGVQPESKYGGYTVNECGQTTGIPDKYTFLNNVGVKPSADFFSVDCPKDSACPGTTYVSHDPRLLDPIRNSLLKLDRPPNVGNIALKDMYCDDLKGYGRGYRTYSDVNAGQIQYYIDHSIEDALYKPVYDIPAQVTGVLYQDPMSNMKPQYNRKWRDEDGISKMPEPGNIYGCLSFIDDTSHHREDIIARQQLKNNQQKWSARWGNQ
ncbi:hypothetical protein N9189_02995 [Pirellulaceae bacterium]|nr:hypothetical protein [Pirellulaceae bacterium]